MDENQRENLFITFKGILDSIIEDKRKNPKNLKKLNSFEARINLGLHVGKEEYFWLNLIAQNGNFNLSKGKINGDCDLNMIVTPEDLLYYCQGEYSTMNMILKKNEHGNKKLIVKKGDSGHNLGILLKLPNIIVLDK